MILTKKVNVASVFWKKLEELYDNVIIIVVERILAVEMIGNKF